MATGDWDCAEHERALSEGTATAGGHLVPTPLSARVVDLARNQARVFQAGALIPALEAAGVELVKTTARDVAAASAAFYDATRPDVAAVRHCGQVPLIRRGRRRALVAESVTPVRVC